MLSLLRDQASLEDAVADTIARVERAASSEETVDALRAALSLAGSGEEPTPSSVESLGGGWTAETALAIGTYAALVAGRDFERAIRLAVNHSGDSDSTGSIAGQIVGIQVGVQGIPERWLEQLKVARRGRGVGGRSGEGAVCGGGLGGEVSGVLGPAASRM